MNIWSRLKGVATFLQPFTAQVIQNVVKKPAMQAKGAEDTTDEVLTELAKEEARVAFPNIVTDDKLLLLERVMGGLPPDQLEKLTKTIGNSAQEIKIEDCELNDKGKKTGKKTTTIEYHNPLGALLVKRICEFDSESEMLAKMDSSGMLNTNLKHAKDTFDKASRRVGKEYQNFDAALARRFGYGSQASDAAAGFLQRARDRHALLDNAVEVQHNDRRMISFIVVAILFVCLVLLLFSAKPNVATKISSISFPKTSFSSCSSKFCINS